MSAAELWIFTVNFSTSKSLILPHTSRREVSRKVVFLRLCRFNNLISLFSPPCHPSLFPSPPPPHPPTFLSPFPFAVWRVEVLLKVGETLIPCFSSPLIFKSQNAACYLYLAWSVYHETICVLKIYLARESARWNTMTLCWDNKETLWVTLPPHSPVYAGIGKCTELK